MATNNFKPFATAANANVTPQADWETLPALLSGFTAGKASSAQVNKALRQASVIASVLAQFIANSSGNDVLDNGDTATILANLISALKANSANDFLQKINNLSDITNPATARTNLALGNSATRNVGGVAGTVAAGDDPRITGALQSGNNLSDITNPATARTNLALGNSAVLNVGTGAGTVAAGNDARIYGALQAANNLADIASADTTRANLGLGSAATKNVGVGSNQIPDMNSFTSSLTINGWFKFPNGLIIQCGIGGPLTPSSPDAIINFNITFPNKCLFITEHDLGNSAKKSEIQIGYVTNTGFTGYNIGVLDRAIPSGLQPPNTATVQWLAIGY
ncbi:gp53-like domain-containing protein [Enterobacter hormaechei]